MLRLRNRPRNVIVMVLDALRHDCVGYCVDRRFQEKHAFPEPHTPTLDGLAERGTLFGQAYTVATTTAPAHAALLTSRFPAENGIESSAPASLAVGIPTLTSLMAHAGYHTVHAVDFSECFAQSGLHRGTHHVFHHDDERVLSHLARHPEGFFLYLHMGDLVAPYLRSFDAGQSDEDRLHYRQTYSALRERYHIPSLDAGLRQTMALGQHAPWPQARGPVRRVLDDFYALRSAIQLEGNYFPTLFPLYQEGINRFDQGRFARFIEGLSALELLDDTLLVVTSGHGTSHIGGNQFDCGLDVSDGSIHVPLFFVYPGVIHERHQLDAPVSLLDVMPTVLEMSGINIDRMPLRGLSLTGSLTGRKELATDRAIYTEHWRARLSDGASPARQLLVQRSMRTDRYKLIVQGSDLVGDEKILNFIDQALDLPRFVTAVNQRFMGIANPHPLETWIRTRQLSLDTEKTDILTEVLLLARSTLGRERYQNLHVKRLRSLLAERIQHHYREGQLDVHAMVRDYYEAWFLDFPTESMLQRLTVLVRHHCKNIDDVVDLFLQLGTHHERYRFYDLEMDPFEEINLFNAGMTIAQERDALAIEIMLMEAFLEGRGLAELREAARTPHRTLTESVEAPLESSTGQA